MKVSIIGLGNFGFAILHYLDQKNDGSYKIYGYEYKEEVVASLRRAKKHPFLFPDRGISKRVHVSHDLKTCVEHADVVIFAVPSIALKDALQATQPYLPPNVIIVNTAKSLEKDTGKRFSLMFKEQLSLFPYSYGLFAGGTIAQDLLTLSILGATFASEEKSILPKITRLFSSDRMVIYPSTDLIGTEYASAFKNALAILVGIVHGMEYSYGTETHILSRAAGEVKDLVVRKLGGEKETFSVASQCFGNDLWMSSTGGTRNRAFGILLGQGMPMDEALKQMEQEKKLVEGMHTISAMKTMQLEDYPLLNFLVRFFTDQAVLSDLSTIFK